MNNQIKTGIRQGYIVKSVIPVVLIIAAFIISFNVVFLPAFERNLMEKKRETIRELTQTAWSILDKIHLEQINGEFTEEEAQEEALSILQKTRYGEEFKDYFWVTDLTPAMLIHPYRPDLNGQDLGSYADPSGKKLFVDAVDLVKGSGEGFLRYMWQWKDDSTQIVPKLSFVKLFEPWGWIIGTGVYLEDVRAEIFQVKRDLRWISLVIILISTLLLIYLLRQTIRTEMLRQKAEEDLHESREKYRNLVEASSEGSFMVLDHKLVYYNQPMANLLGYKDVELYQYAIEDLFLLDDPHTTGQKEFEEFLNQPMQTRQFEVVWKNRQGQPINLVLSVSRVTLNQKDGYIGIVTELSGKRQLEKQIDELGEELQSAMLLMNQPVGTLMRKPLILLGDLTVTEAARQMSAQHEPVALIQGSGQELIGLVTDRDLRERILATSEDPGQPIFRFMSAPLVFMQEQDLLFEAQMLMQEKEVAHLVVKNSRGQVVGIMSQIELARLSATGNSFLLNDIEKARSIPELVRKKTHLDSLVRAMVDTGAHINHITRFLSAGTDRITQRIIEQGFTRIGDPPVPFAFLALGSEGRKEQTLTTDQDNALIYADPDDQTETVRNYFMQLTEFINQSLDQTGYALCPGQVMASNPAWCQSLSQWKKTLKTWVKEANPTQLLDVSIFFDFRMIYGDLTMVDALQSHIYEISKNQSVFFYHLAQQSLQFKPPLDVFGNIQFNEKGPQSGHTIDLKKCLMPIITFGRVYALKHQIDDRETLKRINQLAQKQVISIEANQKTAEAFRELARLRLKNQARLIASGAHPHNHLMEEDLSAVEKGTLRKVLGHISELQLQIKTDFPEL